MNGETKLNKHSQLTEIADNQIKISFFPQKTDIIELIEKNQPEEKKLYDLLFSYHYVSLLKDYDQLLSLANTKIEKYWHQIETVKKVLKYFHGRVLLCDEVGLGKTIEAGLLIKEYALRGLAKKILILAPASLVFQWKDEMLSKFDLEFATSEQSDVKKSPLFQFPLIIASISYAKSKNNFEKFTGENFDLVVVDEAHHLKNTSTLNWKLVNSIKKKFIFLLTATPVQNNLIELFNLLTLLKPGILKTEKDFKLKYVDNDDPKKPKNAEMLRELLREVMIRNTRALVDINLPTRFAQTFVVEPLPAERALYLELSAILKASNLDRLTLSVCLRQASSSFPALAGLLQKLIEEKKIDHSAAALLDKIKAVVVNQKDKKLLELIKKNNDKKIVFVHFLKTLEHLKLLFEKEKISFVAFSSLLSEEEKEEAILSFKDTAEILLSTESGGEGRNLQFCNTLINYDLPWNPMQIEQRIGRIHRIGQERNVFIFNLCLKDSIEDQLLKILESKINMFELVIGEIGSILGNLKTETEFSDIILSLWLESSDLNELNEKFDNLGDELARAKEDYLEVKKLDQELFSDNYET
ncbi:DEAD/DEAH box helicase family protein [Candidatus Saganbacteria bacterium]|nr:DEAD/DEAH box helicase family protein [Candidatus Saganbacteria bacterium]